MSRTQAVLTTTAGVMLELDDYNRMASADKFLKSGPVEHIVVSLVNGLDKFGMTVRPETTISQLARCLSALSENGPYYSEYLRDATGVILEPSRTLKDARIADGARLFPVWRSEVGQPV